jgi:hypothetical protein
MKFLKKFELFEEVIYSYDWTWVGKSKNIDSYRFIDEFGNEFKVEFDEKSPTKSHVRYLVKDNNRWTYKEVSTNIWRLLKTILSDIIKDYISRNKELVSIKMVGLGRGVNRDAVTQRTIAYWRYLKNNPIEGWSIDRYGNNIYLDKN